MTRTRYHRQRGRTASHPGTRAHYFRTDYRLLASRIFARRGWLIVGAVTIELED